MEGIVLEPEVFGSLVAFFGGVVLLAVVAAITLFGAMAGEEKTGTRLYGAEWPLPESEPHAPAEPIRKAA